MSTLGRPQAGKAPAPLYRWVILAVSLVVLMNYGAFYSYGVFFKPLIAEFGWSRAATSLAFSFYLVTYSTAAIPMGWLYDRFGPRWPIALTALLIGGGFAGLSQVSSLWMLYLFFGLVAALGHGATWLVTVSTVMRWFEQRRGMALGVVTAGMGVGTLLFPPLSERLIGSLGWRGTFLSVGVVAFSYNALAALLLRREPPAYGLAAATAAPLPEPARGNCPRQREYTLAQALATRSFWSLYLTVTLGFASYLLLLVHLVPYATDQGMDPQQAAGVIALIGLGALLGRLGLGTVSDRIGRRQTLALAYGMNALGVGGIVLIPRVGLLYPIALAVGFFGIGASVVVAPLMREFFGQRNLGKILGAFMTCGAVSGFLGPYLAGYLFDLTGSYSLAFVAALGIASGGALSALFVRPPLEAAG